MTLRVLRSYRVTAARNYWQMINVSANKEPSLTFGTAASPCPSSRHAQDGVHLVFP